MNNRVILLAAALAASGCATTSVESLPDLPGLERVTTKKCSPKIYPFYFTASMWADPTPMVDASAGNRDSGEAFGMEIFARSIATFVTGALDVVTMPIELIGLVDQECKSSYADRPIPDYKKVTQEPPVMDAPDELLPPPHTSKKNHDAVVVVIGIQHYRNADVPSVDYALNDADVFREYAVKAMGVRPDNVILVKDASKGDLERVLGTPGNPRGQLYDLVAAGKSDVVVYYSGHGAPDPETRKAYLVPADGDPNYARLNGYPVQLLFDNLNAIHARSATVVLDACFSGGSASGPLLVAASPLMITTDRPSLGRVTLFASSGGNEISSWFPQKRHGLFTFFFLQSIQKSRGHQVTAAGVQDYLRQNVPPMARRLFGREQEPEFYGDGGRVLVSR